ncbi:hypothetical protein SLEP1_g41803 [Rubroshorea leprosula]|uniref:Uncharacterized protein n=1 Tax=Rubroshorea leprosula TaxID=152421 RepID=A0AAV5L7V4_9ROSI|nr:hypothetical protein SLEP1_g41803 [Rubroshorea leprosula]
MDFRRNEKRKAKNLGDHCEFGLEESRAIESPIFVIGIRRLLQT